jgi:hypothetical protein
MPCIHAMHGCMHAGTPPERCKRTRKNINSLEGNAVLLADAANDGGQLAEGTVGQSGEEVVLDLRVLDIDGERMDQPPAAQSVRRSSIDQSPYPSIQSTHTPPPLPTDLEVEPAREDEPEKRVLAEVGRRLHLLPGPAAVAPLWVRARRHAVRRQVCALREDACVIFLERSVGR